MKKQTIEKQALGADETCKTYGLNPGTMANLRHARKGPKFYKAGKKVIYFVEDIEAWLRQNPVLTIDQGE